MDETKLTSDVMELVQFCLREVEAWSFYTSPKGKAGGRLGWTWTHLDQVTCWALEVTLKLI